MVQLVAGRHFVVHGMYIGFFKAHFMFGRGWVADYGGSPYVKVIEAHEPIIQNLLTEKCQLGQEKMIGCIAVTPYVAITLFLDDIFTLEHLEAAQETDSTITLNDVLINGKSYRLIIRPQQHNVAILDKQGNIL
jgi:hypothetical protein